jgi:hypothetical protein
MRAWGVHFMAGTDTPYPPQAAFILHDELALLVKGGLTPMGGYKQQRSTERAFSEEKRNREAWRRAEYPIWCCAMLIRSTTFTTPRRFQESSWPDKSLIVLLSTRCLRNAAAAANSQVADEKKGLEDEIDLTLARNFQS